MAFLQCKESKPSMFRLTETLLEGDAQASVYNIYAYSKFITCQRSLGSDRRRWPLLTHRVQVPNSLEGHSPRVAKS